MTPEIAVESLMATPEGRDEIGRSIDEDELVYCPECERELPWGAPIEAHDHDYAGPVTRYHPDGTVEEVDV
ncbi:hypothetical protein [Halococcus sp. PRR34]|uniref:hypothetical protein n=1 Tax=Halococcus sp. PRR34 TaxID=3020830 RepID=UPI002360715C|nr:hypothetical protein [Halococcus sp. PRR34]